MKTQYMPIEELAAVPRPWEKWVPVPLSRITEETKRRVTEALAEWDQRSHKRGRKHRA